MDTKRLRQRVLDLAIHGKLVPQNPQDEPASELLKRIAAEKERLVKEGKIKKSKKKDNEDLDEVPFEVPQGWVWTKLGDVVIAVTDGDHMPPPQSTTGIPFLVISDVNEGFIKFEKARFVPQKYYDNLPEIRKAERGDILFTVTGSYGIVIPVDTDVNFCFQRHIGLIKVIESREWLSYILRSQYVKHYCDEHATGTAQKTVGLETLRMLQIPLPPLAEQHRIVSEVEKYFSLIDILEESENDLQQSIQKAKSKILDLAIKGKLVEKTGEWEYTNLGSVFQHNTGKALNRSAEQSGKLLPYITTSNLYWGRFELDTVKSMYFKENEIEKCTVTKGDLLVCEGGDIGRSAIWDYDYDICIQNHIHRLRPIKDALPKFYYYVMMHYKRTDNIEGKGIGMLGLSSKQLDKLIIPFPPLAEQHRIVARIEELFTQLDNIAEALK